ncbi:MAG: hypothetical protein N2C12_11280, partial [Planctomycetales bacterium]
MISKKLNSTTAMVLVLSFLQPMPGLAQSTSKTESVSPEEMLASSLLCLENFNGKPKEAEEACLEELNLLGVVCDPDLLESDDAAAKAAGKDRGASTEKIAERIVRAANAEACATDAAEAAEEAQIVADA